MSASSHTTSMIGSIENDLNGLTSASSSAATEATSGSSDTTSSISKKSQQALIHVPGVSSAGRAFIAELERRNRLDATRITMELPQMTSTTIAPGLHAKAANLSSAIAAAPSSSSSSSSSSHQPTLSSAGLPTYSYLSELHDPTGDAEILHHLRTQRSRFDMKLSLPLQVRLMEMQGIHDVKVPSHSFLSHIESGVNEAYGWTELYQCTPPREAKRKGAMTREASRRRLLGTDKTNSIASLHQSNQGANSSNKERSTHNNKPKEESKDQQSNDDGSSSILSSNVSFAILPAHQLSPAAQWSPSTHSLLADSPSGVNSSTNLQQQQLEYKSGHGYLTGSQTARTSLAVPSVAANTSIQMSLSNQSLHLHDVSESDDTNQEEKSNSPRSAEAKGKRWGGTTAVQPSSDPDASTPSSPPSQSLALVPARSRGSDHQLLPQLGRSRFQQTVISISSNTVEGRQPNYYIAASQAKPFIASTFGYTEREVCKEISKAQDAHGPYSQNISYTAIDEAIRPHTSTPSFKHNPVMRTLSSSASTLSKSSSSIMTPLETKLENAINHAEKSGLNLDVFRRSTLQPLANSDGLGRSIAADVRGGVGFNVATALGGILSGNEVPSVGFGPNAQTTLRTEHPMKKMSLGPGSYFVGQLNGGASSTAAGGSTSSNIPGPSYGPVGHGQEQRSGRHSYITDPLKSKIQDNSAPWKYEPMKKEQIRGIPKMNVTCGRDGGPSTARTVNGEIEKGMRTFLTPNTRALAPSVRHSSAPAPVIQNVQSTTSRFTTVSRHARDAHTLEIARLIDDKMFKGNLPVSRSSDAHVTERGKEKKKTKVKEEFVNGQNEEEKSGISDGAVQLASNGVTETVPSISLSQHPSSPLSLSPPSAPPSLMAPYSPFRIALMSADEKLAMHAAQAQEFGTAEPVSQFVAAQNAIKEVERLEAVQHQATMGGRKEENTSDDTIKILPSIISHPLPSTPAPPPPVSSTSASNPSAYIRSLSQFLPQVAAASRAAHKEARKHRMDEVLTAHKQMTQNKRTSFVTKIHEESSALESRLSRRQLNSRWFVLVALGSRLNQWHTIISTKRIYMFLNHRRENAARKIQATWKMHQARIKDAARQKSFRILRRNFKVLLLRRRIRKRIQARNVLVKFFRDVIQDHQDRLGGSGGAGTGTGTPRNMLDAVNAAAGSSSKVRYHRGTVNSVVAVIRHFKSQIATIQRSVRRYFLLRDAQLRALSLLWDAIYEKQRKLFVDYSRKYKLHMDGTSLQEHVQRTQAQQLVLQKNGVSGNNSTANSSPSSSSGNTPERRRSYKDTSTMITNRMIKSRGRPVGEKSAKKKSKKSSSRLTSPIFSPPRSHSPPPPFQVILSETTKREEDDVMGELIVTHQDDEEDGDERGETRMLIRLTTVNGTSTRADDIASDALPPTLSRRPTMSLQRALSISIPSTSSNSVAPSPSSQAQAQAQAQQPVTSSGTSTVSVHSSQYPQIFTWDRKLNDAEKAHAIWQDWHDRRKKFVQTVKRYQAAEESFVKDQYRGLTAAKRLLNDTPLDEVSVSRAHASAEYRRLYPVPTFRGLLSSHQMIRLINASLNALKKQQRNAVVAAATAAASASSPRVASSPLNVNSRANAFDSDRPNATPINRRAGALKAPTTPMNAAGGRFLQTANVTNILSPLASPRSSFRATSGQ